MFRPVPRPGDAIRSGVASIGVLPLLSGAGGCWAAIEATNAGMMMDTNMRHIFVAVGVKMGVNGRHVN